MAQEHYEFSQCALDAIERWWPDITNKKKPEKDFQRQMRGLQADLIRCHGPAMDAATRARAAKTLAWLESQ